ncbi:hypothetical protein EDB89DRAFT_1908741 [Lactarius sanguifluus]|nr:hypothetical protein EDB89DRAFT_1908741 [Lactarius sanguifluus]
MDETINSTAYNPVILSKDTNLERTVLFDWSLYAPDFRRAEQCDLAPVQNSKRIQARHNASSDVRSADALPRDPRYKDVMTTSELTLSSLAWLTASAAMRDTPSVVSERLSVGSGKMKGHYICSLRKVADEADVVLLALDTYDTNRGRGMLTEEQEDKRLGVRAHKIDA